MRSLSRQLFKSGIRTRRRDTFFCAAKRKYPKKRRLDSANMNLICLLGDCYSNLRIVKNPNSRFRAISLKAQIGKHHTHVLTYKDKSVAKAGTFAWRKALKRAGIEQFRWYDLRHS